jgi:hypothetical protein
MTHSALALEYALLELQKLDASSLYLAFKSMITIGISGIGWILNLAFIIILKAIQH